MLTVSRTQEALADSFEAMTLYEDALIQYDELEASFFQHVKGQPCRKGETGAHS